MDEGIEDFDERSILGNMKIQSKMSHMSGHQRERSHESFALSALLVSMLMVGTQFGCNRAAGKPAPASLELHSNSFVGDSIPNKFSSCKGEENISPELSWQSPPNHTQSFSLIETDKDSYFGLGGFVHWVVYDLPADKRDLPENLAKQAQLPDGSRQGPNDFGEVGYLGPCPPGHSAHRYVFDLYALDAELNLPTGATKKQLVKAMKGHILASGELTGRYQH